MTAMASSSLRLKPALAAFDRYGRTAVVAILLLLLAWRLAALTWLMIPKGANNNEPLPAATVSARPVTPFDPNLLASQNLFGTAAAAPTGGDVVAPTTDLPLTLRGVYAENGGQRASAIIEANGEQSMVFLGEAMPGGANATLKQVHNDRVVLDRSGRLETLKLVESVPGGESTISLVPYKPDGASTTGPGAQSDAPTSEPVMDRRADAKSQQALRQVRDQLAKNPMALMKMMSAQPAQENGKLIGYRVGPGADPSLFGQSGLQRNDIITAINGVPLSDPSQMMNLQKQLSQAQELNIVVRRGGEQLSLLLGTGEGQKSEPAPEPAAEPMPEQPAYDDGSVPPPPPPEEFNPPGNFQ